MYFQFFCIANHTYFPHKYPPAVHCEPYIFPSHKPPLNFRAYSLQLLSKFIAKLPRASNARCPLRNLFHDNIARSHYNLINQILSPFLLLSYCFYLLLLSQITLKNYYISLIFYKLSKIALLFNFSNFFLLFLLLLIIICFL